MGDQGTCCCCGKVWNADASGYLAATRRCRHRYACVRRALGRTPAKAHAVLLRKEHERRQG